MRAPLGYISLRGGGVRAMVRSDLAGALAPWLLATPLVLLPESVSIASGRGAAWRVTLPGGVRAVLRHYRRGGVVAGFNRETYFGIDPRPFRELAVTIEARRRGVAAPEVLAARVDGRLAYRGAILTSEIADAVTLVDALRTAPDGSRRRALAVGAGRAVSAMHRAGVCHADLNLTNLLTDATGPVRVTVLDFDRARLAPPGGLGARACRRNLRRLARSLRKLDPAGLLAGPDDVAAFHVAYACGGESPCAS